MSVTVLIPAHNEEKNIAAAIDSLKNQTVQVDRIVVVDDRSTDNTFIVALDNGATVYAVDPNNPHKKAGALNEALRWILPRQQPQDKILVMDADSFLDESFVEIAEEWLDREDGSRYGGIGGTFRGRVDDKPNGLLQRWVVAAQQNEYIRYEGDVRRKCGKILVLTGTATLFNVSALKEVVERRGDVYDTKVLTEDNELTLALRHLGWEVRSPEGCTLTTEVMPTWSALARQRLRWKRGAMENLAQYGFNRITAIHWGYQVVGFIGIAVMAIYLATLIPAILTETLHLKPVWIAVTVVFALERMITVRRRGWKMMLMAVVLLPEMIYDIVLQAVHIRALVDATLGRTAKW